MSGFGGWGWCQGVKRTSENVALENLGIVRACRAVRSFSKASTFHQSRWLACLSRPLALPILEFRSCVIPTGETVAMPFVIGGWIV